MTSCTQRDDDGNSPAAQLQFSSISFDKTSRSLVDGVLLLDGQQLGAFLVDADGADYDGGGYANLQVSADAVDASIALTPAKDISLTATSGTLYAYYPHSDAVSDIASVPVTSGFTDYLWATPVTGLDNQNTSAAISLHHALAAVRVGVIRGSYTGDGLVESVTLSSGAFVSSGTLNATSGAVTPGSGTQPLVASLSGTLSTTPVTADFAVVPSGDADALIFRVRVDGQDFTVTSDAVTLAARYTYNYTLTLDEVVRTTISVSGDVDAIDIQQTQLGEGIYSLVARATDDTYFVSDDIQVTGATYTTSYDTDDNLVVTLTDTEPEVLVTMGGVRPRTTDFAYTGTVQPITLPSGTYRLQCWGAQGGTSAGSSGAAGSRGGYAEGQLTLTETTTLYAFVGGQGSAGSSTSLVNGGWNGGGASVGYSSYGSTGDTDGQGISYPACGGGATDFSTVTSTMNYSSGRTARSSESLLGRFIVAGGGAGGSYASKSYQKLTDSSVKSYGSGSFYNSSYEFAEDYPEFGVSGYYCMIYADNDGLDYLRYGGTYTFKSTSSTTTSGYLVLYNSKDMSDFQTVSIKTNSTVTFTLYVSSVQHYGTGVYLVLNQDYCSGSYEFSQKVDTYSTVTDNYTGTNTCQGGGTSGLGQYPGTQSAGGNGNGVDGTFGFGGNQTRTNYRYASGGAGGGWYGGGSAYSDSSSGYVNYSGGGSGFVNTAANASYRPSGYTGLQLDSGTTTAGNASFVSTSGGTETGHAGNGYARVTRLK